jgi:hypothetical protein
MNDTDKSGKCPSCDGRGWVFPSRDECWRCRGTGTDRPTGEIVAEEKRQSDLRRAAGEGRDED